MSASQTLLAPVITALEQAGQVIDTEFAQAAEDTDALTAQIADLNKQLLALQIKLDPWYGIDKTGATEVSQQIQALLDAGHTNIPAGVFLIDPTKTLRLPHGTTGAVDVTGRPTTFFKGQPNAAPRDCIYEVNQPGAAITNIFAIGDRMAQAYTIGSTNEWGYGGRITGKGVILKNCYSILCTGDGFGVMAPNVTLDHCYADQNRRQGLSGFNCPGLKVIGGAYTNTGTITVDGITDAGAKNGPWAGIDIEPDKLSTGTPDVSVTLSGVRLAMNKGAGILGYLRAEVGGLLKITVTDDCEIVGNADGVRGEALAGSVTCVVTNCRLLGHHGAAVRMNSGASATVNNNTIQGLQPRATKITKAGIVTAYDLKAYGTGQIVAGTNTYI